MRIFVGSVGTSSKKIRQTVMNQVVTIATILIITVQSKHFNIYKDILVDQFSFTPGKVKFN